jgi:rhamnosyltransferase
MEQNVNMPSNKRSSVYAVLVTWNPDLSRLAEVLRALSPQVSGIVAVDNGSTNRDNLSAFINTVGGVEFIGLMENLGLGAALNIGIQHARFSAPTWILTLDQDTVIFESAIEDILESYLGLGKQVRDSCGLLALRAQIPPSTNWFTSYSKRVMVLDDLGSFVEKLAVITSGNLIRADLVEQVHFNESFFIDQVDFDFCLSLRQHGYRVIEQKRVSMDHRLGERITGARRSHPYENAERLYYIVRNSTFLVLRGRLPVRYYFVQIIVWSGAYVSTNGGGSLVHCAMVILRGTFDGALSRLGRREYRVLYKGRRPSRPVSKSGRDAE